MTQLDKLKFEKKLLEDTLNVTRINLNTLIDINNFPREAVNKFSSTEDDDDFEKEWEDPDIRRSFNEGFYYDIKTLALSAEELIFAISVKNALIEREEKKNEVSS